MSRTRTRRHRRHITDPNPAAVPSEKGRPWGDIARRALRGVVEHQHQVRELTGHLDELLGGAEPDSYPATGMRRVVRAVDSVVGLVAAVAATTGKRSAGK